MRSFVLGCFVCAGCVADANSTPMTNPFVGTWSCVVTASITVTGKAPTMSSSTDTVVVSAPTMSTLNIVDKIMGQPDCTINASASGATASITGGSCMQSGMGTMVTNTFNGGSFNVNGNAMNGNVTSTFTGTSSGGPVTGNAMNTFKCTK